MSNILLANLVAIAALMLLAWLLSLPLANASIMDIFWGLGFVSTAWVSLWLADDARARAWLVTALTTLWGLRLAGYLLWRSLGKPEDRRYSAFRERYGDRFRIISLPLVFGLQGGLIWLISLPLASAAVSLQPLGWLEGLGTVVWTIGFCFEAIGDYQLACFKADPANRGQVLDRGLWRYTRHPNYFGDFLVWWGLYLLALPGGSGWWVIISPLVMSVLLMRVSGVTLLERSLASRTSGYREYIERTSAFFPWPPKRRT